MSHLLSKASAPDAQGCIQKITAESANWKYVGFELYQLAAGETLTQPSGNNELCLVLVTGLADVTAGDESWKSLGERMSLFEGKAPYAVYVPPNHDFSVTAVTDLELAICKAPAVGKYPVRLITPDMCSRQTRGVATNTRHVCNILFDNLEAESLLVCEVSTPSGNWSSYPPHKHDSDNSPTETLLEETYYHRINPEQGFIFQRVYTDDRSLDETMSVENHGVVMVPEGYHPVGVPHGYQSYYLNVMAGPSRNWIFHNDPDHEWIIAADKLNL
ncbi:MAG: 5-deoxy-glucuronate isomerase [Oceanospirillaceae bacterium]|nr:5-deoxy-glucuronate isomerase [Oceanospirillaceae bacterium]